MRYPKFTESEFKELWHDNKANLEKIAQILGIKKHKIYKYAKRMGINKKQGPKYIDQAIEIFEIYCGDMFVKDLAKLFRKEKGTIRYILRKGIKEYFKKPKLWVKPKTLNLIKVI